MQGRCGLNPGGLHDRAMDHAVSSANMASVFKRGAVNVATSSRR